MNKKISVLIVTLLMCLTAIVITPEDLNVEAAPGGGGDNGGIGLNYSFIYDVTEELSKVIFNAPLDHGMQKGRAFGTTGELFAAQQIIKPIMENDIGLYNVTLEQIENMPSGFAKHLPSVELTEKLEILSQGITINNESNGTNTTVNDFHIRPEWNWRLWAAAVEYFAPNASEGLQWLLDVLNIDTSDNTIYNLIFNDTWLTKNVSYENLSLILRPTNCSWFFDVIFNNTEEILNNESIVDYPSFLHYFLPEFQVYYDNITLGALNASNAGEELPWFNSTWKPFTIGEDDDFLYIAENPSFNPNATTLYPCLSGFFDWVSENKPKNIVIDSILKTWRIFATWLWKVTMPNCKGLVLYDFNDDTYDMNGRDLFALPILYINGSTGKPVYNNCDNYNISFWVNQNWNDSVESYNVIGQINGTNSDETIIISSLYDSWWNQGTADSAIGMAIVLSIAKYFKDYNIIPKCNIKFAAFGGEEYGMRGAYYYEANHPNENITTVIDLNQLGFDQPRPQTDPRLTFAVVTNNQSLNSTLRAVANETDYVERTKNTTNFTTGIDSDGGPSNVRSFAVAQNRTCDTILFLKDTTWIFHHRDGLDHTEGDVMGYYNETDVNVTAELVWNITKYFTVNPDCWFESVNSTAVDTDDEGIFVDSVMANFTVKSILPHDLVRVEAILMDGSEVVNTTAVNFTVNSTGCYNGSILVTLPMDESQGFYDFIIRLYNSTGRVNEFLSFDGINYNDSFTDYNIFLYPYGYDYIVPIIANVTASPSVVGFGFNVTISADVTSNVSDIDWVKVAVIDPDLTLHSCNMDNTVNDTYEYVFNDTWKHGLYKFRIRASDVNGNQSVSSLYVFNVSATGSISVCTVKDSYNGGMIVNLTDPPGDPPLVGYEFLDDDQVLRIWNKYDSYYFNTSNGVQFSNHYDEYWTCNVLMLGYYDGDMWNLMYRTDDLSGFNKNVTCDNESFVNATLWKNLSYGGYDFRLAIRYHLGVDDNMLTVIPFIKNIDDSDIPYVLGFGWEIKDIQIANTIGYDYIRVYNNNSGVWEDYVLNQTVDKNYTDMGNFSTFTVIDRDDSCPGNLGLNLWWDKNLIYKLQVKNRSGQFNAPVSLFIRIGSLVVGQVKSTELFWHDDSWLNPNSTYDEGGRWMFDDNCIDGNTGTYAEAGSSSDGYYLECLVGNISCDKVRIYCCTYGAGEGDSDNISIDVNYNGGWHTIANDVTITKNTYVEFSLGSTESVIKARFKDDTIAAFYTFRVKVFQFNQVAPSNDAPMQSNQKIWNITTGEEWALDDGQETLASIMHVSLYPTCFNVTVNDSDGDYMNVTILTNESGSWTVVNQTTGGMLNGTFYAYNTSWVDTWDTKYWISFNVSDDCNWTNETYYFMANNYAPVISNPYPCSGSGGIGISPVLNITVEDADNDTLDITWSSNSSGNWTIFGTNSSVNSGTYHQGFVNASVNGMWWYWRVNVSDGKCYSVSDVFSFFTGFESKIENTGSTDFKGFLLMQVQFYNASLEEWVVADDTVNETTVRTISSGELFALDTLFNGQVNTGDLLSGFGSGTYCVYVAFRDPDGNVLEVGDSSQFPPETDYLEAWHEFMVTYD